MTLYLNLWSHSSVLLDVLQTIFSFPVLKDDGLSADLIVRQKQLDRQRAREMVQYETDKDLRQFEMTVHRINRVSASITPGRIPLCMKMELGWIVCILSPDLYVRYTAE